MTLVICLVAWVVVSPFVAVGVGRYLRVDVERPSRRARRLMSRRRVKWNL